jgi:hypothetical protein
MKKNQIIEQHSINQGNTNLNDEIITNATGKQLPIKKQKTKETNQKGETKPKASSIETNQLDNNKSDSKKVKVMPIVENAVEKYVTKKEEENNQ